MKTEWKNVIGVKNIALIDDLFLLHENDDKQYCEDCILELKNRRNLDDDIGYYTMDFQ